MKRRPILVVVMILLVMANVLVPNMAYAKGKLAPPVQVSPEDGATNLPTTVTVSWAQSIPGETYRVQVATDPTFTPASIISDGQAQNATGWTVLNLTRGATYYWHVN